jgi:hypothetical protein
VTGEADFTSLLVDESEFQYSDFESDTTAFMLVAGSHNWPLKNIPTPEVLLQLRALDTNEKYSSWMALPDTGTSRTIIMRRLLDNANINYDVGGKEPIITANSTSLGCVGNVLLDVQIDRGKHLTIDALVVDDLSSRCLIAWKDMQRAGIISPSYPARVHVTKKPVCTVPKISDTTRKCTVPKSSDMGRKCTVPKN